MYNSPFKNKSIDKANGMGRATTSNSMMSAGPGDPPKNNKSSNIVTRMGQLDELISKGESGKLSPQEAGKWRTGQYTKEKRSLDLQLKSDYPDTWKNLHQKDGSTVVGATSGGKGGQVTAKEVGVMTDRSESDVLKRGQKQAKKLIRTK